MTPASTVIDRLFIAAFAGAVVFSGWVFAAWLSEGFSVGNLIASVLMGVIAYSLMVPILAVFAVVIWLFHNSVVTYPWRYGVAAAGIGTAYGFAIASPMGLEVAGEVLYLIPLAIACSAIAFAALMRKRDAI